eukprot:scaffold19967_cov45-Isochrysis_galbana.AAC.1
MGPIELIPLPGRSPCRNTPATPGACRAAAASTDAKSAGACSARMSQPCSVPGGAPASSVYSASPVV